MRHFAGTRYHALIQVLEGEMSFQINDMANDTTDDGVVTGLIDAHTPQAPRSFEETGFGMNFLLTLVIKCAYVHGFQTVAEYSKHLKLGSRILVHILGYGQNKDLFDALTMTSAGEQRYELSEKGRNWAVDALDQSMYIGPAPVRLPDFARQAKRQSIADEKLDAKVFASCFDGMVLPEGFLNDYGPAVNSGHSILLYGAAGNGKSIFAKAIIDAFAKPIYVPYSLEVDGQVINVFDSSIHRPMPEQEVGGDDNGNTPITPMRPDRRWVRCYRPMVITGGELTLDMLDLQFNPISKVYEAPLQFKVTGGVFVIDDFGRQRVEPSEVLNRWIIPLERRTDYLTLSTGKKFPVPFDALVMFSTNLTLTDLFDEATRRRIRYKFEIGPPTVAEYLTIFEKACEQAELPIETGVLSYLFDEYYPSGVQPIARFQPQWIVDQVISNCDYQNVPPRMDLPRVKQALAHL